MNYNGFLGVDLSQRFTGLVWVTGQGKLRGKCTIECPTVKVGADSYMAAKFLVKETNKFLRSVSSKELPRLAVVEDILPHHLHIAINTAKMQGALRLFLGIKGILSVRFHPSRLISFQGGKDGTDAFVEEHVIMVNPTAHEKDAFCLALVGALVFGNMEQARFSSKKISVASNIIDDLTIEERNRICRT